MIKIQIQIQRSPTAGGAFSPEPQGAMDPVASLGYAAVTRCRRREAAVGTVRGQTAHRKLTVSSLDVTSVERLQ